MQIKDQGSLEKYHELIRNLGIEDEDQHKIFLSYLESLPTSITDTWAKNSILHRIRVFRQHDPIFEKVILAPDPREALRVVAHLVRTTWEEKARKALFPIGEGPLIFFIEKVGLVSTWAVDGNLFYTMRA